MLTKKDIGRIVSVTWQGAGFYFDAEVGTICDICSRNLSFVGVRFDRNNAYFHSCGENCEDGYGYYVPESMITFIDEEGMPPSVNTAYASLDSVLSDAMTQASKTKGVERHANNNNYEDQVICVVQRLLKDHPFGGHAYQAIKKTIEAGRLLKIKGPEAAYQETLGAINYLSAMGILIKEEK